MYSRHHIAAGHIPPSPPTCFIDKETEGVSNGTIQNEPFSIGPNKEQLCPLFLKWGIKSPCRLPLGIGRFDLIQRVCLATRKAGAFQLLHIIGDEATIHDRFHLKNGVELPGQVIEHPNQLLRPRLLSDTFMALPLKFGPEVYLIWARAFTVKGIDSIRMGISLTIPQTPIVWSFRSARWGDTVKNTEASSSEVGLYVSL